MWQREKFAFFRPRVMRPGARMGRLLGAPWMSGGNTLPCCHFRLICLTKRSWERLQGISGLKPSLSLQLPLISCAISKYCKICNAWVSYSCLCGDIAIFVNIFLWSQLNQYQNMNVIYRGCDFLSAYLLNEWHLAAAFPWSSWPQVCNWAWNRGTQMLKPAIPPFTETN